MELQSFTCLELDSAKPLIITLIITLITTERFF